MKVINMNIMRLLALILCVNACSQLNAQYEDIFFEDYVYTTNIKSVQFYPMGEPLMPPVLNLNDTRGFVFSFDDMDNIQRDYSYEILHLNKDWTEVSNLEVLEYIDGFQNEEIDESNPSINTFVPYINYTLALPNDDLNWSLSGNYLLIVYEGNEEDERLPVITRRFMIVDRQVNVVAKQRRPNSVSKIRTNHEFDLFVNFEDFSILDPMTNISVEVMQNSRSDHSLKNLKPLIVIGNVMTIDNTGLISFPAYKEFRQFDIRSLDYPGIGVHSIDLKSFGTDVLLDLGKRRNSEVYLNSKDANGRFVIENKDVGSDNLHGDYAKVIFSLQTPKLEEEVYVMGSFTDYQADEMYRMIYDYSKEIYLCEVDLKQGYYNYFFGIEKDGKLDPMNLEGSWNETENDYQVFVYLREPGDRYDRLIGFSMINSNAISF